MTTPTAADIVPILEETPNTLYVTISKKATKLLNEFALTAVFWTLRTTLLAPGDAAEDPDWTPPMKPRKLRHADMGTKPQQGLRLRQQRACCCSVSYASRNSREKHPRQELDSAHVYGRVSGDIHSNGTRPRDHITQDPRHQSTSTSLCGWMFLRLKQQGRWLLSRLEYDANLRYIGESTTDHVVPMSGVPHTKFWRRALLVKMSLSCPMFSISRQTVSHGRNTAATISKHHKSEVQGSILRAYHRTHKFDFGLDVRKSRPAHYVLHSENKVCACHMGVREIAGQLSKAIYYGGVAFLIQLENNKRFTCILRQS